MYNLSARPDVYALAERLNQIGAAVRKKDWNTAEASWSAFKAEVVVLEARAF